MEKLFLRNENNLRKLAIIIYNGAEYFYEKILNGSLDTNFLIEELVSKKYMLGFSILPKELKVQYLVAHRILIQEGRLFEFLFKEMMNKVEVEGKPLYSVINIDSVRNKKTGETKQIDLLFKDLMENQYYYVEIKLHNNHDTGKDSSIDTNIYSITNILEEQEGYKNIKSILCFVKENIITRKESKNFETLTGDEFLNRFVGISISFLYEILESVKKDFNFDYKILDIIESVNKKTS